MNFVNTDRFSAKYLRNKDTRKLDNYCNICEKGFVNEEKYKFHIYSTHITCEVDGCNYSAPKEIMHFHKMKHIKNSQGKSIIDSAEDIEKWLNSRKAKYPRTSNNTQQGYSVVKGVNSEKFNNTTHSEIRAFKNMSALECFIRKSMQERNLNAKNDSTIINSPKLHEMKDNKFREYKRTCEEKSESLFFRLFKSEIRLYESKLFSVISHIVRNSRK